MPKKKNVRKMTTIVKQMRMRLNRAFAKSLLLFASKNNKKKLHKQMFANDANIDVDKRNTPTEIY